MDYIQIDTTLFFSLCCSLLQGEHQPAASSCQIAFFPFLLSFCIFCFYSSPKAQRAAKATEPQNRMFSDRLQKHDYPHFKGKTEFFYLTKIKNGSFFLKSHTFFFHLCSTFNDKLTPDCSVHPF